MAPRPTLGGFLRDQWLPAIEATVRPSTFVGYRTHVRRHIVPALGRIALEDLEPVAINTFYRRLLAPAPPRRALSPTTVRRVHATLHRALRDAVRWGLVAANAAHGADPPRVGAHSGSIRTWSAGEVRRFLEGTFEDGLFALWVVLACTGMRRGEALGLRWKDLDLDACRASISETVIVVGSEVVASTPKSARGRRVVALDATTVAALELHRMRTTPEALSDYVFGGREPLHPAAVSQPFRALARSLHLPRIRLHDLRHTHASIALQAGVHPKIVSERLGHATVAITLDIYSHVATSLQHDAAAAVEALIFGPD